VEHCFQCMYLRGSFFLFLNDIDLFRFAISCRIAYAAVMAHTTNLDLEDLYRPRKDMLGIACAVRKCRALQIINLSENLLLSSEAALLLQALHDFENLKAVNCPTLCQNLPAQASAVEVPRKEVMPGFSPTNTNCGSLMGLATIVHRR
jgi:hypothetical protein